METLFRQRVNYAKIELFKNYCILNDRYKPKEKSIWYSNNHQSFMYDNMEPITSFDPVNPSVSHVYIPHIKNKKALCFDEIFPLKSAGFAYTTDSEKIKKYYCDVFAGVTINTLERSLCIKGDKLILKTYTLTKSRHAQTKFFKKKSSSLILSINLKTGNFNIIEINGKNKSFKTNYFKSLKITLKYFIDFGKPTFSDFKLNELFKNTFTENGINSIINELIGFKIIKLKLNEAYENFLCWFVNKKKIKTPDDFFRFLDCFYPTEKYLKRNDRKLIMSILDMYGIKSKITNRIVHQYPDINIKQLAELCYLFGEDYSIYLAQLDSEWFNPSTKRFTLSKDALDQNKNFLNISQDFTLLHEVKITDKEKIIKVLNNILKEKNESSITDFLYLMMDHFKMLKTIREYDADKNMSATTYEEFRLEHDEYAKLISKIKKGWTIEYQYNLDMLQDVEKPVTIEINLRDDKNPEIVFMTFYPHVLKREEDYIEEGEFMHHCVASYADKDKSVIISLRTEDAQDRITCEFDGQTGICIQARHFCNRPIPGDFDLALDKIKSKTKYYSRRGMLHHTHKKRVPLIINNIEVRPPQIVATLNENLFQL